MHGFNGPRPVVELQTKLFTSSEDNSFNDIMLEAVSPENTPSFAAVFNDVRHRPPKYPPENIFSKV